MGQVDMVVLTSRWLHLIAAVTAIGGAIFMRFALSGAAREVLDDDSHRRLKEAVRRRWAKFVHGSIALLLLTGSLNFVLLALPPKIEPMPYHAIFGLKFLAALLVFVIGTALVGRSPAFAGVRERQRQFLNLLIALALFVLLISGVLNQVRGAKANLAPTESSAIKAPT